MQRVKTTKKRLMKSCHKNVLLKKEKSCRKMNGMVQSNQK